MDREEGFPVWKATRRKMELQLDQEEGEDKERSKRVRCGQGFESIEDNNNVDLDIFDSEKSALRSLSTGKIFEEGSEVQVKDSWKEGKEMDKYMPNGKDKTSSSYLRGSAHVLFSRSLEPEESRCIDGSEFLLIQDNDRKEKSSLSEQEVFGRDVVQSVWDAWQRMDEEAIDNILVTACEEILKTPFSPNQYHCINFVYISEKMPEAFSLPKVYKALLKLLSSSDPKSLMNKSNLLPIFASKLLYRAFIREFEWPIEFIQAFLVDIVGPCAWIELESCKDFVGILSAAFQDSIMVAFDRS